MPADPAPPSVPGPRSEREALERVLNKLSWCVRVNVADDPRDATFEYPLTGEEAAALQDLLRNTLHPASDAPTPEPCRDCLTVGGHKHDCAGYADEFARLFPAAPTPAGEREDWGMLMQLIDDYGYACAKVALRRISPLDENAARDRLNDALAAALRSPVATRGEP